MNRRILRSSEFSICLARQSLDLKTASRNWCDNIKKHGLIDETWQHTFPYLLWHHTCYHSVKLCTMCSRVVGFLRHIARLATEDQLT